MATPVICREAEDRRDALIEKLAALPPVPHGARPDRAAFRARGRRGGSPAARGAYCVSAMPRGERPRAAQPAGVRQSRRDRRVHGRREAHPRLLHGRRHGPQLPRGPVLRVIPSGASTTCWSPAGRADQAIQGLGRTHRTHQASAPMFRPVTTDVKGERRFIATIARRLDSLGAITRGQRDSQTAMGGSDCSAVPRERQSGEPLRQGRIAPVLRRALAGAASRTGPWSASRRQPG